MAEAGCISDKAIAETLGRVFGQNNVVSPEVSAENYFQVFFATQAQADAVAALLDAQGFGDDVMQDAGGFVAMHRPNIILLLGHDANRPSSADTNRLAVAMIDYMTSHAEALKAAVGLTGKAKGL